jgi:hypothetical protein
MAKPESTDLVNSIQKNSNNDYRQKEKIRLIDTFPTSEIQLCLEKIKSEIPNYENEMLQKGVLSCMMGAIYGFKDRELEPLHKNHTQIFKVMITDIEAAFNTVNEGNLDEELWLFECFDYGIKQVYYLDWQLYLSKVCY